MHKICSSYSYLILGDRDVDSSEENDSASRHDLVVKSRRRLSTLEEERITDPARIETRGRGDGCGAQQEEARVGVLQSVEDEPLEQKEKMELKCHAIKYNTQCNKVNIFDIMHRV